MGERQPSYSPRRRLIWDHLTAHPGLTVSEIARGGLRLNHAGSARQLLERMEHAGQVTRRTEYRAQQGKRVSLWYAVPGAPPPEVPGG